MAAKRPSPVQWKCVTYLIQSTLVATCTQLNAALKARSSIQQSEITFYQFSIESDAHTHYCRTSQIIFKSVSCMAQYLSIYHCTGQLIRAKLTQGLHGFASKIAWQQTSSSTGPASLQWLVFVVRTASITRRPDRKEAVTHSPFVEPWWNTLPCFRFRDGVLIDAVFSLRPMKDFTYDEGKGTLHWFTACPHFPPVGSNAEWIRCESGGGTRNVLPSSWW